MRACITSLALPLALLSGCELDLERVRIFIPFDPGPIDDASPLCDVKVHIDFTDDGLFDLERTYHFAQNGTLRKLDEAVGDGFLSASELDEPLDVFAPPRETVFEYDNAVFDRIVAKTRLDPSGAGASRVAKAGFVDDHLRTSEVIGEDAEIGPATSFIGYDFVQATASWRRDEEEAWRNFEFENRYVTRSEDDSSSTSTYGESLTHTLELETSVGFLARTRTTSNGFETNVREFLVAATRDAGGLLNTVYVDGFDFSFSSTIEIERTDAAVDIVAFTDEGFTTASVQVEKSGRGHVHRVWEPGSFFACRTAVTDPLGTPLWLRNDASWCLPLVEEVRGVGGLVERVVMATRTVTFAIESTCDDVCTLREARPLDDGSMLALADALFYVSPIRVVLRAEQNAVVDDAPFCEVSR